MAYSNCFFFVVDENDKPIKNAIVTIKLGGILADIYKNRGGTATVDYPSGLLPNPAFSGRDGRVSFYATPDDYTASITSRGETAEYTIGVIDESDADEYYHYQNTIKNIDGEITPSIISVKNSHGQSLIYSDEGITPSPNPIDSDGNLDFYIKHGRYNFDLQTSKFYDVLMPVVLLSGGGGTEEGVEYVYTYDDPVYSLADSPARWNLGTADRTFTLDGGLEPSSSPHLGGFDGFDFGYHIGAEDSGFYWYFALIGGDGSEDIVIEHASIAGSPSAAIYSFTKLATIPRDSSEYPLGFNVVVDGVAYFGPINSGYSDGGAEPDLFTESPYTPITFTVRVPI